MNGKMYNKPVKRGFGGAGKKNSTDRRKNAKYEGRNTEGNHDIEKKQMETKEMANNKKLLNK